MPLARKAPPRRRAARVSIAPAPASHAGVWFMLAGVLSTAAFLALVVARPWQRSARTATTEPAPLVATLASPDGAAWLKGWQALDAYVSIAEFTEAFRAPVGVSEPPASADASALLALAGCADDCAPEHAFRISAHAVAVLGTQPALHPDGTRQCIRHEDGGTPDCYGRLTVDIFDFAAGERVAYVSGRHLTERGALSQTVEYAGTVTLLDPDSGILTVVVGGVPRAAALSPSAIITNDAGERLTWEGVFPGVSVRASASRDEQGGLTVHALRVSLPVVTETAE